MLNSLQEALHRGTTEIGVILALIALTAILALLCIAFLLRLHRLHRRLTALTRSADGADLEQALDTHMRSVDDAVKRADALEQSVAALQAQVPACVQRVSLVRYDAFEDVGGEQSFAVALLNGLGDGIVLSSIYTRKDVRVYAKSVTHGQSSHTLSEEEQTALDASK